MVLLQTALVLRSIQRGYIPDKSFVIVSFLATGVLLIGWRSALAVATQVAFSCALFIVLLDAASIGKPLLLLITLYFDILTTWPCAHMRARTFDLCLKRSTWLGINIHGSSYGGFDNFVVYYQVETGKARHFATLQCIMLPYCSAQHFF